MDFKRITAMLDKTFAFSINRTFSREEAEELTQEIMLQALKSSDTIKDETKFEPWFWRLAEITLKVYKRGKARLRTYLSFDDIMTFASEDEYDFEKDAEYQNLRRKVASLSASFREILVMYYYDNLTCKEISQKLGIPEGTVTYRLSMARSKIKKECGSMTESALKPVKLEIRIAGEANYNGEDRPFPWQYINDSLSQNILWYAYREPKTVEELSRLTGVPAFYIEERIQNLIAREAVIQPTQNTVQTDFLIFDEQVSKYGHMYCGKFAQDVSEEFYAAAKELTEKTLQLGIQDAGRTFDELICLFSLLALDEMVQKYKPTEFTMPPLKYDGSMWEYHANVVGINYDGGAALEYNKNMNHGVKDSYAHYVYHFPPFVQQRMMYDHEIAICQEILRGNDISDRQKEDVSKMIADGYLRKRDNGKITVSMPVFTTEQFEKFKVLASDVFGGFMPHYNEQFGSYVREYIKLFPSHLKDQANRCGFYLYVSTERHSARL